MKPLRNIMLFLTAALISVASLTLAGLPALAATPHEPPETARVVFSGISLFRYYTEALDFTLSKSPEMVEARLEKMPFANIPPEIDDDTGVFAASGINLAYLIAEIDENINQTDTLITQYRFDEAAVMAETTGSSISEAGGELGLLKASLEDTGVKLKVVAAPADSDLRSSYDAVLERVHRLEDMLARYDKTLAESLSRMEYPNSLSRTSLTLEIAEVHSFVGDEVHFSGRLTSGVEKLAGRNITLITNGQTYLTATTDDAGYYRGTFLVPYWYVPYIDLKGLYYPVAEDIGQYLSATSPVVRLDVSFYESLLDINVTETAYPGLDATINGTFDYGQNPLLVDRQIEIYLDDTLLATTVAGMNFSQEIGLSPELTEGNHVITVSAAASGRYTGVVDSGILRVTREILVLEMNLPTIAVIPGSINLSGNLHSPLEPPAGALIQMRMDNSLVETVIATDGTFNINMKMGLGFTLFGSQELEISVIPLEPWHAPLVTARKMLVLNAVNCGGILLLLALVGIVLRGRLRGLNIRLRRKKPAVSLPVAVAPITPEYSGELAVPAEVDGVTPRQNILRRYKVILQILQKVTSTIITPQKTLREFARESSPKLGPLSKYFLELTAMVERLLYSSHQPTQADSSRSAELKDDIEKGIKSETS